MTKSRIFKKIFLRKKADRNFGGNFLKNHFRHLKLHSNHSSWLVRSRCHMGTFWKTKDWSSHFWEDQSVRFWYKWVHRQRTLKSTKTAISQVYLNLRLWPAQKSKVWSFFYGKRFIWENSVVWKVGDFGLKTSTLPRLHVVAICVAYLAAFTTIA